MYSSLAEIMAARIARTFDVDKFQTILKPSDNVTRTGSIIRAIIDTSLAYRLHGLGWVRLQEVPALAVIQILQDILAWINEFQEKVESGEEIVPHDDPTRI